jgi:hypothetical protein
VSRFFVCGYLCGVWRLVASFAPVGARSRATGVARLTKMNTDPSVVAELGLQNSKKRF